MYEPNLPITNALYGTDHPDKRPPRQERPATPHGVRVHEQLDERSLKRIVRKFPRCRKYLLKRRAV
jgi:hypothetical protein